MKISFFYENSLKVQPIGLGAGVFYSRLGYDKVIAIMFLNIVVGVRFVGKILI